jgi:serine carboxypeptidase-like clade 2
MIIIYIMQILKQVFVGISICSGDTDMVVSVTSTKYTLRRMKLQVKTAWRAWFDKGEVT